MTEKNSNTRHVSFEQMNTIIDFMGQHVEFALGNYRSLEARHTSKKLWEEVAKMLNSCRGGLRKTPDGWSKYWSDYKNKIKKKIWALKKNKSGPSLKDIPPLSKMENRVIAILGNYFEKKRRRVRNSGTYSGESPPVVKLETFQETVHMDNYSKSHSADADDLSNDSGESSGEYVNDDSNLLVPENIYPQWLIDIEKKRADAELIRAKAEEQRAAVAGKTAEAALVQADALKRLADAASVQAEAIMRIATALENRGHGDMLTM